MIWNELLNTGITSEKLDFPPRYDLLRERGSYLMIREIAYNGNEREMRLLPMKLAVDACCKGATSFNQLYPPTITW